MSANPDKETVACYRIARGQAGFSDGIENGAHLLLAEAFDVYTDVANQRRGLHLGANSDAGRRSS